MLSSLAWAQKPEKAIWGLSGMGKGFVFVAKDSSMSTTFHLRTQGLLSIQGPLNGGEKWTTDALIRRWRLKWAGFALNPRLTYKFELGLSNRDTGNEVEEEFNDNSTRIILDANVIYQFHDHWKISFGQAKLPGNRERVISSGRLELVDRSLVNAYFNIDRDMGFQLVGSYKIRDMLLYPKFAISTGDGRNISEQSAIDGISGYCYTTHLDFLPFGKFLNKGDYSEADLEREPKPKLAVGLTYDFNDGAVRQGGQLGDFIVDPNNNLVGKDLHSILFDFLYKHQGWSVLGEFAYRKMPTNQLPTPEDSLSAFYRTGHGYVIQAGYVFKNNIQPVFRYTFVKPDNAISAVIQTDEFTFGLSKYFVKHSLKTQLDATWQDPKVGEDRLRFRFQLELEI